MIGGNQSGAALSFRPRTEGNGSEVRPYKFNQIKVQVLEIANEHVAVQKAAAELFFHLILVELWRYNGMAVIRDADLAEMKGWSCDKVSRAVRQLAQVGVIEIERGRWNRATEYRLGNWVWAEAIKRRQATEKVTDFPITRGPQNSADKSAGMPTKTQQKRPVTKESQDKIAADLLTLRLVPLTKTYSIQQWSECLEEEGIGQLKEVLPIRQLDGVEGYWLPGP
ncbi:hypothetical protein Q4543_24290 [Salipiger sp. 1_MG-2023]|uniref:hypothetical protein n=1 Tax=Salipiger sp. 1_MG-2023 TaxID=3062665 RepID=UPI0026E1481A|nr:hypothetical protein [Salipiger sp. 1_MG-2023]MDO6588568.1 hypothetical protein [Salipiger sp. 1_MG-2023]